MSNIVIQLALRSMAAEEALASCEIEGIVLSPRDSFVTKCNMIWPNLEKDVLETVFDHFEHSKEQAS